MWKPVSTVPYKPLNDKAQILVITCPIGHRFDEIAPRWKDRAVAIAPDSKGFLKSIVRDLLANPQVRNVVFDGPACGRAAYDSLWGGTNIPGFDQEHLQLLRQFVDLWDDDCGVRSPMQPFWPARIMYLDDKENSDAADRTDGQEQER